MKTIVKTEVIPATEAEEVQHTVFGCDHCDFESDEEEKVSEHHGKTHALKKQIEVGSRTLLWFDTEADALSWLNAEYTGWANSYEIDGVKYWGEPGWYVAETGDRPCGRGCCSREYVQLVPIESILTDLRDRADRLTSTRESLEEAIIPEAEPCPTS